MNVPNVIVGERMTPTVQKIIRRYLAHRQLPVIGVVATAKLANQAIDWWNALPPNAKEL